MKKITTPESNIARRDFLRALGITGLMLGANQQQSVAEPTPSHTADDIIVGLEVGTSKVCVVVAEKRAGSAVKILGIGEEASRGVRKGEFVDVEVAGRSIREALVDAKEKSGVMIRDIHLAAKGRNQMIQVENSVECLKRFGVQAVRIFPAPEASAESVLDLNEKMLGALVIDMGGGTTEYAVYSDGKLKHSGSLPVGGDHITHDLFVGLEIPIRHAEKLKRNECGVSRGQMMKGERIVLSSAHDFSGKEIKRSVLDMLVQCRTREMLELVRFQLQACGVKFAALKAGLHLTGGCSMQYRIDELAHEIFDIPAHLTHAKGVVSNANVPVHDPRYACAIGLVKSVTNFELMIATISETRSLRKFKNDTRNLTQSDNLGLQ